MNWSRIDRPGRISVFSDSGGVRAEEIWGGSNENRQTRAKIDIRRFRGCLSGEDMGQSSRESPGQGEYRYSPVLGVSGRRRHGRGSPQQGKNRFSMVQGVSVWERHRSTHLRIARSGRESIFCGSGGVRSGKTWVGSPENRQTRVRIGIRRFRGCLGGGDLGQTV